MKTNILAALILLATASTALANGSRLPSQDALAVARGYAYTATADDPSAIYYNPAGLGPQSGDVEAGVSFITPSSSYTGPGGSASTKDETFTLPYLYATEPVDPVKGLVLGVGVYAPFGLSTQWPSDGPFRTIATSNTLTFIRTAFSVGYDFHNGLMIGASIQDNSLKADLNRGLGYLPGDNFNYTGRDNNAWSYNVGVIWRPSEQHSFGFTYQSRTTFNLDGSVTLSPPVGITAPGTLQWVFPDNFALGYSYRPNHDWNFELGYDRTDWSVLKTITLMSQATGPVPIVFNWKDSAYYGAGVTRYNGDWHYSAGVNYSANSVNDSTWSPSVPDYGKWLWNAGIGFKVDSWDLETALQWSPSTSRTVTGSPPSALGQTADGTYTSKLWGLVLQASYRW
jgi:long-chain fatty acid transport protein